MIRILDLSHAAEIAALHKSSFFNGWDSPEVETMLTTPGTYAWGMQGDAGLHGMLIVRVGDDTADILTLAVAKEQQRQGLAQQLLAHGAAALKAHGVARYMLEVAVVNVAAITLYAKLGFAEIARRRAYYGQPDGNRADALVMEKTL